MPRHRGCVGLKLQEYHVTELDTYKNFYMARNGVSVVENKSILTKCNTLIDSI